jgi:hypothetical protein
MILTIAGPQAKRALFFILLSLCAGLLTTRVQAQPARDSISDRVGATAGQFRVDESGSATYAIPIYTPPGTAGVVPQLGFSYSSQGGNGPLGKGWGISGASGISRCRATREHGDFFANGAAVDGDPAPINFSGSDKFCLDGQRLITAPATAQVCKALAGTTVAQYRTELESFQRVCAYTYNPVAGPRFFTVERKDGSTSWYGDRVTTAGAELGDRPNGAVSHPANPYILISWAQSRFQDSAGNYIDYLYHSNPTGPTYSGEQLLAEIQYTGKVVLPGQTGVAKLPYAKIRFNYSQLPASEFVKAYASGAEIWQTFRLHNVQVFNGVQEVRYYQMGFQKSLSGSNLDQLNTLRECSNSGMVVCYSPTTFDWSVARNQLATSETPTDIDIGSNDKFEGYQLADIDGDGRQDMVWLQDGNYGQPCVSEYILVAFGAIDSAGRNTFSRPNQTTICTEEELVNGSQNVTEGSWMLFDYNGDGRDDIFMTSAATGKWVLYPSLGRPSTGGKVFDNSQNLIAGLTPFIPYSRTNHPVLADFNGDGLFDVVYQTTAGRRARLMQRNGASYTWGNELAVNLNSSLNTDCSDEIVCERTSATLYKKNGSFQLLDFNGDSRSDLLTSYTKTYRNQLQGPGCGQPLSVGVKSTKAVGATTAAKCISIEKYTYLVTMNVTSITSAAINFDGGSMWQTAYSLDGATSQYQTEQRFADFNGDGLTDMIMSNGSVWSLWSNTGNGFINAGSSTNITTTYTDNLQIVDVNGDGRSDVIYPQSNKYTFDVRYGLATGGFAAATAIPGGVVHCHRRRPQPTAVFITIRQRQPLPAARHHHAHHQWLWCKNRIGLPTTFIEKCLFTRQ